MPQPTTVDNLHDFSFELVDHALFPNPKKHLPGNHYRTDAVEHLFYQQNEQSFVNSQMSVYMEISNAAINKKSWN